MVDLFAITLLLKTDKTLLVRRCNASFGNGLYSLIGGKVENGEAALHGIKREVFEETGLDIDEQKFELVHTLHRRGLESEFIALCFKTDISHLAAPINKEPSKHDDMSFFSLNQLPQNILPAHKQAIELSLKNIGYSEHNWK
jgi:ADP-ribose pyrophosphatase YjhB (NUDIX family)